ncbi:MAG: caspase family protein [Elainellaceae cyanobacterium]
MGLKRRAFLQQTALALTALGVSQASLSLFASRYQQALAQPTRRKLALLVGINQYPEEVCDFVPNRGSALNGCITDIELQKELLIHRFGFQPDDVLILTDQQATREAIEAAFMSHLVEQAQSGDVVVFHFSGLGSRVKISSPTDSVHNTLVPVDGVLPTEDDPLIHDIFEETLVLLLRSLKTSLVTTILDISYVEPQQTLLGNLRVRSRPNAPSGQQAIQSEQAFQDQLLSRVNASREQLNAQLKSGQLPGLVMTATGPRQIAAEAQWNGFSAGLFTYALTQQLWWSTPATSLRFSLNQAGGMVEQLVGNEQQPRLEGLKADDPSLSPYFLDPKTSMGADGVVRSVEADGKTFQLWLGGLPASVIENYGNSSVLSLHKVGLIRIKPNAASAPESSPMTESVEEDETPSSGAIADAESTEGRSPPDSSPDSSPDSAEKQSSSEPDGRSLQIRSREGLLIKARLCCSDAVDSSKSVEAGLLVRESMRVLPRNISLIVALDSSLERIERVDATSALSAIPRVSSVVAGEQPADCLFGKIQAITPTLAASFADDMSRSNLFSQTMNTQSSSQNDGQYGLFYLSRAAIPNTLVESEEAVKTAINRLTPQLRTLLARKLLRLTTNEGSSRLGVRATLEMVSPQERIIMQRETIRAPWEPPESRLASLFIGEGAVPTLPVNSRIQYRLQNYSDRSVYCTFIGLDSNGNAIAVYPALGNSGGGSDTSANLGDSVIEPGEILLVPQASAASEWVVNGSKGLAETFILFSRSPLSLTASALADEIRPVGNVRRPSILANPLKIVQTILQDLHRASINNRPQLEIPADSYALDVNTWASMNFVYRVMES